MQATDIDKQFSTINKTATLAMLTNSGLQTSEALAQLSVTMPVRATSTHSTPQIQTGLTTQNTLN